MSIPFVNPLINTLIRYLPTHQLKGGCICDVLDKMYSDKLINFIEMDFLIELIHSEIDLVLLDEIIETNNYKLFTLKLNALKD